MPLTPEQGADREAWQNSLATVDLTPAQFTALLEYSTTLPTGKTVGKQWKRYLAAGPKAGSWLLGEYVEHPQPDLYVGIRWQLIRIV